MAKRSSSNKRQMLDVIRGVVKDKYVPSDQSHMQETGTGGRKGAMQCQIDTNDEEVLLCRFDQGGNNYLLFPYFQQQTGMTSMCDYIMFVEDNKEVVAFSIDLKDTANGPKQQTLRAKTFAQFMVDRIRTVYGSSAFPKPVRYRQVGIKTTCEKMTTKGYANLTFDPDGYLVLPDYHHFYTRMLMDI